MSDPPGNWSPARRAGSFAQGIRIVMITPALRGQKSAGADQRGEVMRDVCLTAWVNRPRRHPVDDAAALEDLAQQDRARIAGQSIRPRLDPKRAVEP